MLTKMIDGVSIICSDEEEKNIRSYWALNDAYTEEEGQDVQPLYSQRKALQALANPDLSSHTHVSHLRQSIPQELQAYWKKATGLER